MLAWARPLAAALGGLPEKLEDERAHLDGTAMMLFARPEALDDVPRGLGFPVTGSQVMLYGGGATLGKGPLRVSVQGLLGGVSARSGGLNTEWRLRLAGLVLEQRYPLYALQAMSGVILNYGQLEGLLEDGAQVTRYDGQAYGGGVISGVRWPRSTPLAFCAQGGHVWLPFNGAWKGALAGTNPKAAIDLGGLFAQAQVEYSF